MGKSINVFKKYLFPSIFQAYNQSFVKDCPKIFFFFVLCTKSIPFCVPDVSE